MLTAHILNLLYIQCPVHTYNVRVNVMGGEESVPGGCTMTTVGASAQVHLQLKGLVDVDKEVREGGSICLPYYCHSCCEGDKVGREDS